MKALLILLMAAMPMLAGAQGTDQTLLSYSVRYVKDHLFLRSGDDFNVVDTDLEWPEMLGQGPDNTRTLRREILRKVLGIGSADLDSAYTAYQTQWGRPVTGQLEKLPDDNRFCYITAQAHIMTFQPGRWICYRLTSRTEPGSLSPVKKQDETTYIIYDIARQKVLQTDDFLRLDVINAGEASQQFYEMLFAPLSDDYFNQLRTASIEGAWVGPEGREIGLNVTCRTAEESLTVYNTLPYGFVKALLSKDARRLIDKPLPIAETGSSMLPSIWKADTIYKEVETKAEFKGGAQGFKQYVEQSPQPDNPITGRLTAAFVVDKTGAVQDVRVVSPLSPECDRHAVALIKGMPRFTPATLGDHPVCERIYLPIAYQAQPSHEPTAR